MDRTLIVVAALALACGSVDERDDCSASGDCPLGQYCARTPDGNVCWADAVPPAVSGVAASCAAGCRRDSILHVTATIAEATSEVLDASVALDLPGGPTVPMARNGAGWEADVELRRFPFDFFERSVVATVTARDGARNVSAGASAAPVSVTRLRWSFEAGVPMTSPAVMDDGTVVVGLSATSGQLLAVTPQGTEKWRLSPGSAFVTAAPAVGVHAVWVGSEDFRLYAAELDGSAVKPNVGVGIGGPIRGSLAVEPAMTKEWAFATATGGDGTGVMGVSSTVENERDVILAPAQEGFTTGPVAAPDGVTYAPTASAGGSATLRAYVLNSSLVVLEASTTAGIGRKSSAPLALDADGAILSGSDDAPAVLKKTVPGVAPVITTVGELNGPLTDVLVLAGGDVLAGDESGRLHRFTSTGTAWSPAPSLGGATRGALALTGTSAPFIVPTSAGKVWALASDGQTRWEGTLPSASGLRAANIHTPAGQTDPVMSSAYFASENGRLYAVVVDGQLDASAPWPKAFHDPKNTNRAGPQP